MSEQKAYVNPMIAYPETPTGTATVADHIKIAQDMTQTILGWSLEKQNEMIHHICLQVESARKAAISDHLKALEVLKNSLDVLYSGAMPVKTPSDR